jgi:hypothetical protein
MVPSGSTGCCCNCSVLAAAGDGIANNRMERRASAVAEKDPNPRCCSLAISRRTAGGLRMVATLTARMSDLFAPISKSTTRT